MGIHRAKHSKSGLLPIAKTVSQTNNQFVNLGKEFNLRERRKGKTVRAVGEKACLLDSFAPRSLRSRRLIAAPRKHGPSK